MSDELTQGGPRNRGTYPTDTRGLQIPPRPARFGREDLAVPWEEPSRLEEFIDGQLFSPHMPDHLRDLGSPPRGDTEAEKLDCEAQFNQRARWRLVRHAAPDADGVTRWRCPFCAGLLRSCQLPFTMRRSRSAPLVTLDGKAIRCCAVILSAAPAELALSQKIPTGVRQSTQRLRQLV